MSNRSLPSEQFAAEQRIGNYVDIENSYRLFFAREPEARAIVSGTGGESLATLIASLLVSLEFKDMLQLVDETLVASDSMLVQLDPDLLIWAKSIAGSALVDDGIAVDRLTVITKFLNEDRISEAVNAISAGAGHDLNSLKFALDHLGSLVRIIGASPLFDESHYVSQLPAGESIANPAAHYILRGERMGLKPSPAFDAEHYAELNLDVASSKLNRLVHYEIWGRQEGRAYRDWLTDHVMPPISAETGRPRVLLLLHEATYTGAPILGWNLVRALSDRCDVIVVLLRGGPLENALRDVASALVVPPPHEATLAPHQMDRFAKRLVAVYKPLYAIANSIESRSIAVALRYKDIPIVALVHEFWPGARPGIRLEFYASCATLIFPARIVEQSSFHAFRETRLQNSFILPQGPCVIPPFNRDHTPIPFGPPFITDGDATPLDVLLADGRRGARPFTVIGLGAIEIRKGIDLFISAAMTMQAKNPDMAFRFIWIGSWEHAIGSQFADLLGEQYARADLGDHLHILPAVDELEPVYARADALFLSSRLDPLPNVAIDAAFRGIPLVCFDKASGMAELLSADPETASLVVPYLDSGAAADRLTALALDADLYASCSEAIRCLARRRFNMTTYAQSIDKIGRDAARKFANTERDRRLIDEVRAFDPSIYFGSGYTAPAGTTPTAVYVDQTRHINFASPPVSDIMLRRPKIGFHPFIYGTEAPGFPQDGGRDPLAHYVEHGMPPGSWAHQVLQPELAVLADSRDAEHENQDAIRQSLTRVALHAHCLHPDAIAKLIIALAANLLQADLFLTITNEQTAEMARKATNDYRGGSVIVESGPDGDRDDHAFLRVLRKHLHGRYDVVGHIHARQIPRIATRGLDGHDGVPSLLWEHLLGPRFPMADLIVDAMQKDCRLGLVFPESGVLFGWETRGDRETALIQRLCLNVTMPLHIEFPTGGMFWARLNALDKLVEADLRNEEMTEWVREGILNRLLPLMCAEAGYMYATTYIADIGC